MMGAKNSILVCVAKLPCKTIALLGCYALLIVGCGQGSGGSAAPATQPAAAAPATTEPAGSTLIIGDQPRVFGPAMLRLTTADGKVEARLYSNEPSGVLSGKETVDSYDFEMSLPDISDPAEISSAVWTAKSASSQREETPYGIFLNQQKDILQPMDVTVHFSGQAPNVRVIIDGMFWMYGAREEGTLVAPPPVMVRVIGSLEATATVK
jgi:hypothetical protein